MEKSLIDGNTCRRCGSCAQVCPQRIIHQEHGRFAFRPDRLHLCMQCAHCMAICPTRSVHVAGLSYDRDLFELDERRPDAEGFFTLIEGRRSIREFHDRPVPRAILERIVDAISQAPMGFPPHKTRVTVITSRHVLEQARPLFAQVYRDLIRWMHRSVGRLMLRLVLSEEVFNTLARHVVPTMQAALSGPDDDRPDPVTRGAPVLLLFHARRDAENHSEDLWVALTYGLLAAHALGLGATAVSLVPAAVERNKPLKELFRIPERDEVVAALIAGYPRHRYRRGIRRELADVRWIDS